MPTKARKKPRVLPDDLILLSGAHTASSGEMCVMEAVAYIAGERWSDHPACACPVISQFLRSWNDAIRDDEIRTKLLKPLIPKVVGTKATPEVELARVMLCIDWMCREFTPAWLELVPNLKPHAETLRSFKPVQSWDDLDAVLSPLRTAQRASAAAWAAARDAAWDAARDAARDAAWAAARDAAWAAARDAARAAARDAATDAAWAAARDAARAAARDAARAAARDALRPTTEKLQQSAVALVERMCALK